MGLEARVYKHEAKVKKDNNNDTFRRMYKQGTYEDHSSVISQFNAIKKHFYKTPTQDNIYSDKWI